MTGSELTINNWKQEVRSTAAGKCLPSSKVNIMQNRTPHCAFTPTQAAPLCQAVRNSAPLRLYGHAEEQEEGQSRATGMCKRQKGFHLRPTVLQLSSLEERRLEKQSRHREDTEINSLPPLPVQLRSITRGGLQANLKDLLLYTTHNEAEEFAATGS